MISRSVHASAIQAELRHTSACGKTKFSISSSLCWPYCGDATIQWRTVEVWMLQISHKTVPKRANAVRTTNLPREMRRSWSMNFCAVSFASCWRPYDYQAGHATPKYSKLISQLSINNTHTLSLGWSFDDKAAESAKTRSNRGQDNTFQFTCTFNKRREKRWQIWKRSRVVERKVGVDAFFPSILRKNRKTSERGHETITR